MHSNPDPGKDATRPETTRRTPLGMLNYMAGSRSMRYTLNREKLVESLKAMFWVIPLTLLIWIYAETEQIVYPNSTNANDIEVNITSSNHNRFVEPAVNPKATVQVNLKLSGPQEAIEKVKADLNATIPRGVTIDTGDMLPGDNQPIHVVDRIQDLPVFKTNGVTVLESQPPDVLVNIDEKKSVTVPVEIAPADAATLSSARFDPPKVTLYGPLKLLKADQLHVFADLSLMTLNNTGEQPPQVIPVRLAVQDARITIDPMKVTASLVIKASDITAEVDAIPVVVEAPFATLKSYDISTTNTGDELSVGNVTITGPPEVVKAIKDHTYNPTPTAVLKITPDDVFRQEPKTLRYDLPPGVHVSPTDAERKIEFKLTPRKDGATPG